MNQNGDSEHTESAGFDRRKLLGGLKAGALGAAFLGTMGPVGAALSAGPAAAQTAGLTDTQILNFALNLEYLEAEFYLRAVTGQGLAAGDTTGIGNYGGVNGGSVVPFTNPIFAQVAADLARDEQQHVRFLRSALGSAAVARPLIDLAGGFQAAASAAGLLGTGMPVFNPFADQVSFLLGAFIFEDVGVTAYNGAAPLISNKTYLGAAASILAVEAYHGGTIRTLLGQVGGIVPYATQLIANLRSNATGAVTDIGVLSPVNAYVAIAPVNANSLAYARTPAQVTNIVTVGNAAKGGGGFFPNGLNAGNP